MSLVGKRVVAERPMTAEELDTEGWEPNHGPVTVLVFDDGTKIYPSQDDEGNGPGVLFGADPKGKTFAVYVKKAIEIAPPPPPSEGEGALVKQFVLKQVIIDDDEPF